MAVDSERGAELRAPDLVEPVVGWRVWLVVDRAGAVRLRSVVYPTLWEPRVETVAECVHLKRHPPRSWRVGFSNHSAPSSRCDCGIYAARELADGVHYLRTSDRPGADVLGRVFGRVSLWGSVVESERGWRGSHAYPAQLYVPRGRTTNGRGTDDIALALTDYGVAVEILDCATREEVVHALGGGPNGAESPEPPLAE